MIDDINIARDFAKGMKLGAFGYLYAKNNIKKPWFMSYALNKNVLKIDPA